MRTIKAREIIVAALLVLLLAAVTTARSADHALYPAKAGDAVAIYLIDNGFHSDIAVSRAAIAAHGGPIAAAAARTSPDAWMMIGWGDAKFYEATSDWTGRVPDALRAALGGRPTVVHLQGVWGEPGQVFRSGVKAIPVSPAGLDALLSRADRSFVLGPAGALTVQERWKGVGRAHRAGADPDGNLAAGLQGVMDAFEGRIVPLEEQAAKRWGLLLGQQEKHVNDKGNAVIAAVRGLTLVSRNVKDVSGHGADVLDPFRSPPKLHKA
ncbi:MAG TPA: DUF2459 domain-containing protein [Caulobacteraceae bacterium]|jgi:hypothetical protein